MIETPEVTQSTGQLSAAVHVTVPREKIQEVMGPGLKEVRAALDAQGVKAAGPWFTHHLRMDPKVFDFEICIPVKKPVSASGRVRPAGLEARRIVRTVYHGGYEGLGQAWGELQGWIRAQGLKTAPDLWEVYTVGPEAGPDPSAWQTELNQPLAD
ncbi:MAG TPA: GyrI-like domain-containing protein [bacterium]|nr:GyrI-like domain-containing protein [bacterium]